MTIILSFVFFIISLIFAIINNELRSASLWAMWAIWAAIAVGAIRI